MKLVYSDLFAPFTLESDRVNVISVEDGSLYYKLVSELHAQCDGHEGGFVLSENNSLVRIDKVTDMMDSFIPFEVNTKRLLTRLYSKLESLCSNELYEAILTLRTEISDFMTKLSDEMNCAMEYDNQADIKGLFKCLGIKFSESGERLSDKVTDYMMNSYELDGRKLFVSVGLLDFMGRTEAELFFRTVTDHKLTLLMLENKTPDFGGQVNRLTIYEDFCVF